MCGIVGYVGRRPGKPIILDGLKRLEYRGYDSAGIALLEATDSCRPCAPSATSTRSSRRRATATRRPRVGLGHTRWATHGSVCEENAHPHADCSGRISVVLNGIIENYKELRAALEGRGHTLTSQTDAEVVVHLIEEHVGEGLAAAVRSTIPPLEGNFAFCAVSADEPELVVGTRREAPLVVGVGKDEMFFASAIPAFLAHTRTIVVLEDGDVVTLRASGAECTDVAGAPVVRERGPRALGRGRRREGRLRDLHAQGDPRAAGRAARHPRRAAARGRQRRPERGRHGRRYAAPPAAHLHRRLRHLVPRRPDRLVRHRAARPRPGADRRRQRVPLPPPGASTPTRWSSASRSRARPPTRSPRCGSRVRPARPSSPSPTSWAARRRARPTTCCSRAPASRSGWRRPRRTPPRSPPCCVLALRLALGARRPARGRAASPRARAARSPREDRGAARPSQRRRGDRRALPRRALLPLPRPRHGLRRLPRGRPQAQGDQPTSRPRPTPPAR